MTKKKQTILVVEDEGILQKALAGALEDAHFEVLTASDGKEGLEVALKKKPDLILLDLNMPVMDGIETLKHLREDKWGNDVYVIILTNRDPGNELLAEAEHEPVRSEYLMKSEYDIDQVIDIVKDRLKSTKH